jgi:hypothetical protein
LRESRTKLNEVGKKCLEHVIRATVCEESCNIREACGASASSDGGLHLCLWNRLAFLISVFVNTRGLLLLFFLKKTLNSKAFPLKAEVFFFH